MRRHARISGIAQNTDPPRVSETALRLMRSYDWPGNVAQLESVLQSALHETKGAILAGETLLQAIAGQRIASDSTFRYRPAEIDEAWNPTHFIKQCLQDGTEQIYDRTIAKLDREILKLVLSHTHGNQAQAAKILGMTRTSLRKKILASKIRLSELNGQESRDLHSTDLE